MSRGKNKYDHNRPNFWGMMQNIFVASMNKGQLPGAIIGIILILLVLKLPLGDTKEIIFRIFDKFERLYILGWVISTITTFGWYFGTKKLRKLHAKEIERISNEKKQLQTQLMNKKLNSSNNIK